MVDIQFKLLLQNLATVLMKDLNICHKNQPPHVIQTGHFLCYCHAILACSTV